MQGRARLHTKFCGALLLAVSTLAFPSGAAAEQAPSPLNAIARPGMGAPKLAGQFQLRLRVADGRVARALLDAGVRQEDAAAVAKLAAGHLGSGPGGCEALVSIERTPTGDYSLMRVQLTTDTRRAVIEWRGSELILTSDAPLRTSPALA